MIQYEEKLDVPERKRQENRYLQLAQMEVWRKDLRPWIMDRMLAARRFIYSPELPAERDEGVAIIGTLEMLLEEVEGISWEKRWERKTEEKPPQEMQKEDLLKRIKKKLKLGK